MASLSNAARLWFGGVEAAEDLLRKVYRIDVTKALDPTNQHDFLVIVKRLGDALAGVTKDAEAAAIKQAINTLDVDWPKMSTAQVDSVVNAARKAIANVPKGVAPTIAQRVAAAGKQVITATKKSTSTKYDLGIDSSFDKTDEAIATHAGKSQAHYVTNSYGVRADQFAKKAREIVVAGAEQGLDRYDIGKDMHDAFGAVLGRSPAYFQMVAGVHVNRSRSYASLASYAAAEIHGFVFHAIMDAVTSLQCRMMHGRSFSVASALSKYQEVAAGDPEDVKYITPWMQVGKDDEGAEYIYTKGKDGSRTRIADVHESAMGKEDEAGKFGDLHTADALEKMGVTVPPLHGNCRSTMVPDLEMAASPLTGLPRGSQVVTPQVRQQAIAQLNTFEASPSCGCPVEPVASNVSYRIKRMKAKSGCVCAPVGNEVYSYFGEKTVAIAGPEPTFPVPEPATIKYLYANTTTNKGYADAPASSLIAAVKNTVDKKKVEELMKSALPDGTMGKKLPIVVKYQNVFYVVHGHEHAQAQYLLQTAAGVADPVIKTQLLDYDVKMPKPKKPKPEPAAVPADPNALVDVPLKPAPKKPKP